MIAKQDKAPELVAVDFDPFATGEVVTMAPATNAQREIWAAVQMEPAASLAFNESLSLRLRGRLEVERLRAAFRRVLERHGSLRATFTPDGVWLCISSALPSSLPLVDLSSLSPAQQAESLAQQARREVETPFDLVHGPLVRAQLFRLSSDEHVFLFTAHHIVCDGWSHWVVLTELAALYSGQELPEPDSFASYASDDIDGQKDEAYWLQRFANGAPTLDLPTDRPRPRTRSYDSAREDLLLPESLVEGLQKLGARHGASLVATFLAGYAAFLHRLTGQEDLVIGVPASGQARTGQNHLVGHCISLLPVRLAVASEQPFTELLGSVRTTFLDALDHQRPSFGRLLESLRLARDPARIPLVSTVFNLDRSAEKLDFPGLEVSYSSHPRRYETFELFINASFGTGRSLLTVQYNTNLFEAATVRRLGQDFAVLLQAVARDPEQTISRLPILTEADRQQLLVEWNDTAAVFPETELCLHQLFTRQAERTPNHVAVICGQDTLTYGELDRRSNQLAHHLMGLGVGPDVLVGLLVERSPEMVVALLAILKAGGAYVPLDPAFPPDRLAYMVADSRMPVLVTQGQLDEALPSRPAAMVRLDRDWQDVAKHGVDAPVPLGLRGNHLAYVLYTSGSTGLPKGVAIPHSALVNFLLSMQREPGFAASDTVLAVTTLSFDIAGLELYLPLVTGGKVAIASRDDALDPYRLMERLREHACTVMQATPATWRALISAGWGGSPGLRVLCGGESMPPELAKALLPRCAELWNMYGPTETTVWSTVHRITSADGQAPIGRPIANTQTYVLDANRELVPPGVVGELYIGGHGLARGYLHRPELTSERFVQSPFTPNARLYRTGDLARWRADGRLECLGRTDHQVKIRGFRIELGEIEAVLVRHPAVRQAVVMAREDAPGDKRLVAYLVAENRPPDLVEQLRKLLRAAVPEYMLPAHFVELDGFRLTPNGKVDRKALPVPPEASVVATAETVGPRNPTEESLHAIWTELLSVGKIGIHDNFFELGGHSLLAIRAMTRIRDVFQVNLPLQRLFENPTVAGLAAAVRAASNTAEEVRRIEPRKQTGPCPLSFAQEQFWLLHQMVPPGSPVYNIVDTIAIGGAYDASALKRALDELVRRHEILRTAFVLIDGQLKQTVSPAIDLPLPELDLTSLPELERAHRWTELVREQGQKAFDLDQPPLFRTTVVHHSESEHRVLLVIHHIVADEWAMRIIQDEVKQLYAAFSQQRPSPLAELPVQYADFACWQRDWFQGEKLEEQIAYWKKELEGASPLLALPTDKPRPSAQTFRGATERFALPKALLRDLRALGLKEQATLFMLLEAAFAALLHRYSGQADILVGTPISGRTQSETGRLVGCFLNTVVLRSQLTAGQTFRAQLQQVRARALGAFAHAELPFGRLVASVAADRDPSRTPLFQAMFVLHDPDGTSPVSNGFAHPELETGTAKFDLSLYACATEHGLDGLMEYNTDLFEADTISRLCRHFGVLLQAIARDPDQSISELPLLTEADRQQLLVEWNRTEADYPREVELAELVEAQAERTPEAVAVVCGSESLAFAELNARANQLAHALRAHGAGPDRLVGICVERSLDMVVALLAVVKAGAAYLPLDPLFPPERLSYMLQDSGASLVVTQDSLRASLPAFSGTVVSLDETSWKSNPRDNPAVAVQPDHLAYVIYTSGSTGRPKGVEVPRGALTNLLWSMRQWLGLTSEDRVLAITTTSFDIAGLEIWLPLLVGARLVVASREEASDGTRLREKIDRHGITFLQATPVTWRLLLQAGWKGKSDLQIVCTGEAMPRDLAVELAPIVRRLWNLYGPTETTIWSTGYLVRDGNQPILIGRPVANTQCYILDGNGHPVPIGVVGELYLGGDGVARGYRQRPELTAEKFLSDPFREQPGARMYRTGDLARYRADGNIECLGRTDHQVKIRGLRLELGEIEAVLAEHPAVRQAVLRVFEPKPGDVRLVAFYVPTPGVEVAPADLRKHLRSKLPEYMIPQQFIAVGQMPLTASGKIDRKALALPADAGGATGERVAPRTPTERFLADLWADLTGSKVESIGANDNFFDVGGHSLLALQAIARIHARTGVLLEARSMFFNSLNQIAEMLAAHSQGGKLPVPPRPNAAAPPGSA